MLLLRISGIKGKLPVWRKANQVKRGKGRQKSWSGFGPKGRQSSGQRQFALKGMRSPVDGDRGEWVYGRRCVLELLRARRRHVYRLVLPMPRRGSDSQEVEEISDLAGQGGINPERLPREQLDQWFPGCNHQGVAINCGAYPYGDFSQVLRRAKDSPHALVLLLDHLQDPQNVGSLMRSAEASGVTAVVVPGDRATGMTPAVVRASAGASEHLLVVRVVNLARAIRTLREDAFLTIWGLDMSPESVRLDQADLRAGVGLVIGGEGRGLGRLHRQCCDGLVSLPMLGKVASLNAAVAGGIALFECLRQRRQPSCPARSGNLAARPTPNKMEKDNLR